MFVLTGATVREVGAEAHALGIDPDLAVRLVDNLVRAGAISAPAPDDLEPGALMRLQLAAVVPPADSL